MNRQDKRKLAKAALKTGSKEAKTLARLLIDELDRSDSAAERLTFALWIYPGYRIDSRGPTGCIMYALDKIALDIATSIREHDAYEAYNLNYDTDEA